MDFTDKLDILYTRRSSEDGKDGESIENQVALLKQYAADKGYYNIKVVTDDGYTGTNFNRPGFQEAFALIQHRRVGRFIVKDLSRLGRNTIEVGQYIGVIFPRFGVELKLSITLDTFPTRIMKRSVRRQPLRRIFAALQQEEARQSPSRSCGCSSNS